jgi:hypothetical protein
MTNQMLSGVKIHYWIMLIKIKIKMMKKHIILM